ncbi:hypothetical protein AB733_08075 [Photobacterium swingsii]|nr:hypothetical protein AB733_08075 [Photobacterium swingsii]
MLDNGRPLVWARSFLFSTHNETIATFCQLGNQSLGEQLLFASERRTTKEAIKGMKPIKGTLVRSLIVSLKLMGQILNYKWPWTVG